jgi:hypothetical protein
MQKSKKEYQKEYHKNNKEKIKKQRKEYYEKNKDRILLLKRKDYDYEKCKDRRLKKQYGISLDEYNKKLEEQKESCAVCGVHVSDLKNSNCQHGKKVLVVDHCHSTGKVRDLLCNRCNTILGLCEESHYLLKLIGEYIGKHNKGSQK